MLINSVELNNFRQFYGRQKINFSTDPDKNITLIHAENGVGKTAFLNAILWCFFEKTTSNFERKKDLLNYHAKEKGEKSYHVFVEFEEDGEYFVAQRQVSSLSGGQQAFRVCRILSSGDHKEVSSAPEVFINSIIPKDMAGYFFFQGEGVGSLANSNGGDVKDAIRDILGFTIAEAALKDIAKVKTDYRRELQRLDKSSDLGNIQEEIANCEDELRKLSEDIEEADKNKKFLASRLKTIEEELKNSESSVVTEKQKSREAKTAELSRLTSMRARALERKARLVGKYAVSAFSFKAANEGIDFIDEKEIKGTIPEPYNVQLVKDIISAKECICGTEVQPGTEEFRRINSLLGKASDPVLLHRVRRARSQLTVVNKELQDARTDFSNVLEEISMTEESINNVKSDLEVLSLEIKDIDIEGIKDKEEQRVTVFKQLQEANRSYGSLSERKRKLEELKDSLTAKESKFKSTKPAVINLQKLMKFIESIEKQLSSVLQKTEGDSLLILARKINDFLNLYVKQDFHAKITKDFEIILYDRDDRAVPKSDGQSLLLSLTFISSLISLAKERRNASGSILTPGAVAPFVIDAPFGVLDKSYKSNIAKELPTSVNQIVFLLSSSHWEGTVEEVIRDKVGIEYNMVVEVAADRGEKEMGSINILGKTHDTVRYGCEVDMTRIEEVGDYV